MKNILLFITFICFAWLQAQVSITPANFDVSDEITITVNSNSTETNCNGFNNPSAVYMHSGIGNDANPWGFSVVGNWGQNDGIGAMSNNGDGTWSITIVPQTYFNLTAEQAANATKMGMVFRNANGTQELKDNGCSDFFYNIGVFQLNLLNPLENSVTVLNEGASINISASTSASADYVLKANGNIVNTQNNISSYSYTYTLSETSTMELTATSAGGAAQTKSFTLVVNPEVVSSPIPEWISQGINYTTDATIAGLAIWAPGKDFIHVIGDFNNWSLQNEYLMHRDTEDPYLFWIEISGLAPGELYAFQYRTSDSRIVADPYSPLILSSYDDQWISNQIYPNLPAYPAGQDFEASIIQTGQSPYAWTVTNFQKPERDNLIVYELLVRDFTSEKDWQSLINKIDYLKGLNINAIELLPIMEFDGNNSWGYNPSFHYALDKAYGTADKFKEFVDVCHQNGIAVILDIALNHATGRSPLVRLWNNDPDGDGYGSVSSDNPYFNTTTRHSYGVFEDFDHSAAATRYYVKRVIQHWISEYNIDGFRWDLTKGFTQNCSSGDDACTNAYQQDRVDVLKSYADYQWEIDPTSFVIFEHLGTPIEEQQWANYRLDEGKGIMLWTNLNFAYNQNTMGYSSDSNFGYMDHEAHGFAEKMAIGYGESHDEERLMYKNLQYGAQSGSYNVRNLNNALHRQKAFGAVSLTIPGPKMIWQFGELGYDFGINRCENGTYNNDCRTAPKPVAFELGYDTDAERHAVYNEWSQILNIRLANDVFKTNTYTIESGNLLPKIKIWDSNIPSTELNNVIVLANFQTTSAVVTPNFPNTGTWFNLMNNTSLQVTSTTQTVQLQPGEFKIFGNQPAESLHVQDLMPEAEIGFRVVNNPVVNQVIQIEFLNQQAGELHMYDIQGKLIHSEKVTQGIEKLQLPTRASTGLYILVFTSGNQKFSQKLLIK
ncbi:MAG: alpha-amylase family glycosyl hydrolase [Flavobacteriaceae bacterium]|nr:alpha-amylase family glycosyl hydrolase [Flavobacteriaceae bacterium]